MDDSFMILQKIVHSADRRQKVIASNIANAETPGYRAKEIKFGNLLKKEMKLVATDPRHMSREGNQISGRIVAQETLAWGDGNNVELNAEVARMTENSLRHDAAVKMINSKLKMYRNAIRGR